MVYNYRKEYLDKVCEGQAKVEQEVVVANKIFDLLNEKYDSFDDFYENNKTLDDFLKNNNMQTAITHFNTFGNPLNEDDYVKILENIKTIGEKKKQFDTEKIETTNIEDKQISSLKIDNENHYVDNSDSDKTITERMKSMQQDKEEFQTANTSENTENMFKEIEKNQESIDFVPLSEINVFALNDEERELYDVAKRYELNSTQSIKIDLNKKIMVDDENNIMKIEKDGDQIKIMLDIDGVEKEEQLEPKQKTYQKTLTPSPNTIYSN